MAQIFDYDILGYFELCSDIPVLNHLGIRGDIRSLPFCHLSLRASKPKSNEYRLEPKTLGDHLRNRRLDLGLLQKDVGQRTGGSVSDVWNWENNRVTPAVKFIPAIIAFLGYNPIPEPATLPERLVWYRQSKGWTQKDLAKVLGVDQSILAGWERGEQTPNGRHNLWIAAVLCPD